jgi:serine/threonine protein phosphatase PrpC
MQAMIPRVDLSVGTVRLVMAAGSEMGNRYDANYDVLHLDPDRPLVIVADGMGDGPGSAIAGRTAVDVFIDETAAATSPLGPRALRSAVATAQQRVRAAGQDVLGLTGCTLTAFVGGAPDDPDAAWLVQIGDSRAYRLREGLLELLTVDHTMAWLGAVYGWFAPDSPEGRAARYRLTRYVGGREAPEPDVLSVTLRPGDVYCLCTDGLEEIPYERLAEILAQPDPAAAVTTLLADTLAAGGRDNATVAVIRVE